MPNLPEKVKKLLLGKVNTFVTILALVPLLTVNNPYIFTIGNFTFSLEILFFIYFLTELVIRFSDRKLHGVFLVLDIIALISFLPYFRVFRLLLLARLVSLLFRVKGIALLARIIKENAFLFRSIVYISLIYMFITSAVVFNVEPETFSNNYLYAFYWSGVTLTTVGYGDIYPVTPIGQAVSLVSSFMGIGIIALPSGVISSNFILKVSQLEQTINETKDK